MGYSFTLLVKKAIKEPNKIFSFVFDHLKYKWIRISKFRGRPYHEFYAYVMSERVKKLGPEVAIGGNWDDVGELQYHFLVSEGLKPQHKFLDLGCGSLRLGNKLIPYLEAGNYYGADISADILEHASRNANKYNLMSKKPHLIMLKDNSFSEFSVKFDFITAHSVFTHMPLAALEEIFKNVTKVMHSNTRFYATYFESVKGTYSNREQDFYFPRDVLTKVANENNMEIEFVDRFKYSQQMFMLRLKG